jgi:hypothetical protein
LARRTILVARTHGLIRRFAVTHAQNKDDGQLVAVLEPRKMLAAMDDKALPHRFARYARSRWRVPGRQSKERSSQPHTTNACLDAGDVKS